MTPDPAAPFPATSQARFREVFEQAPISMQLFGTDGRTLQVNRAWETLWQGTFGPGLKQFVLEGGFNLLTDPQLQEKGVTPYLLRAVAGESVQIPAILYDPTVLGVEAQPRWVTAWAHPIKDDAGRVVEVVLMHEDITERLRAEEAVRLSEERFRSLVTATTQMVWTCTADGVIVDDSPSWRAFTGQTYDEWKGDGWLGALHPDDREQALRAWAASVAARCVYESEYRVRRADGAWRWTVVRAVPLLNSDGTIREWIGSNSDIHDIKTAQAELARRLENEKRQSAVLARVAAAAHTLHTAPSVDAIAAELVVRMRDLLQAHQAVISLPEGDDWSQAVNAISFSEKYARYRNYDARPTGKGIYAEVCRTNKAMRLTQAELERHPAWKGFGQHAATHPPLRGWLAVPLIGQDGRNLGVLQVSDKYEGDFTEEDEAILTQLAAIAANGFENARLYASLQEQHRRKDEFLAMLAHELRNPLAPIRAAADLLSFDSVSAATVRQTSAVISRQVQHMSGLVDDLLDVSRVTRGLIELASVDLDIKRVVADALEQVRPLIETKRHELSVTMTPEPAHVLGDHKRLVQILTNILNNAAKYTPRGGAIHVRAEATREQVILTVQDSGIGMPPALQPHVFELFAQAERSADRSQGGLGIGLALVKSLVDLHGGSVACHSDGAGQGSRFVVALPRLDSNAEGAPADGAAAHPVAARGRHVLVVDDNVDAARMLAMYLEASGHVVAIEHLAQHALERAVSERPDVCILDIGLPDMDGNTLARKLRERPETARALLIALTSYGSEADKANAIAAGFDHHLVKPVDSASLAAYLATGPGG